MASAYSTLSLATALTRPTTTLAGVPTGFDGKVIADLSKIAAGKGVPRLAVLARDGNRLSELDGAIRFFAPDIEILPFPAWDCMPYDRVSPHPAVVARRMATLAALAQPAGRPSILLAAVNAAVQRVPIVEEVAGDALVIDTGGRVRMDAIIAWLERHGFSRASTVREAGEYAVRGGIVDLFPAGQPSPIRLDFFGDLLETIRRFNAEDQRSSGKVPRLELLPTSELALTPASIARFRQGYVSLFGAADRNDILYEAISDGRRSPGMEHWLPLFTERLGTIFDYLPGVPWVIDHLAGDAVGERLVQVGDHYSARSAALDSRESQVPYKPLPPDRLYLTEGEWRDLIGARTAIQLSPFVTADAGAIDLGGRQGRTFAAERNAEGVNVFDAVIAHSASLSAAGKRVVIACWSEGSRDRMGQVLVDRGLTAQATANDWPAVEKLTKTALAIATLPLETGFETGELAIIGEQDILGDRLVRPRRRGPDIEGVGLRFRTP